MEIMSVLTTFKAESDDLTATILSYEEEAARLKSRLAEIEQSMRPIADRREALRMSIESLELLASLDAPTVQAKAELPAPVVTQKPRPVYSRMPKRVGKFDKNGNKIAEYKSINQCAMVFGWNHTAMQKYIQCTSKEKQIRLRGYYLSLI